MGHGTHVSGIIAGKGLQMDEGVAPECSLMAVRVLATMKDGDRLVGAGIVDNINSGIKWAVDNGADVINMSLGIRHTGGGLPHQDVVRYALSKNVAVVAASGNDGTAERYYPGALKGVFAVGAADERRRAGRFHLLRRADHGDRPRVTHLQLLRASPIRLRFRHFSGVAVRRRRRSA